MSESFESTTQRLQRSSVTIDSLFDLDVFDHQDSDYDSDARTNIRPEALSASLTFASSSYENPPTLQQVKGQERQQRERLQDLRQLGGIQSDVVVDVRLCMWCRLLATMLADANARLLLVSEIAREGAGGGLKARRDALEKTYREILDRNPEHLPTLNEYALLLTVSRGEHDAAEELYLCALDINPFHKRTVSLFSLSPSLSLSLSLSLSHTHTFTHIT